MFIVACDDGTTLAVRRSVSGTADMSSAGGWSIRSRGGLVRWAGVSSLFPFRDKIHFPISLVYVLYKVACTLYITETMLKWSLHGQA